MHLFRRKGLSVQLTSTWMFSLIVAFCCGQSQGEVQIPPLDTSRVDELGWTDAHHVAFGSPLPISSPHKVLVPSGHRRQFLEAAPEAYLCQQNYFGQTALHLAVRENALDIVQLYAYRKLPCMNSGNLDGDTPLHYAAAWGRLEAAEILLQCGVDPTVTNDLGELAHQDASRNGHKEIASLLKNGVEGSEKQRRRNRILASRLLAIIAVIFVVAFEIAHLRRL